MKRKIIVNNKEFTMPKMSIDTYTEYLELAEVIDAMTTSAVVLSEDSHIM